MKIFAILLCLLFLFSHNNFCQLSGFELIKKGDEFADKEEYEQSIKEYTTAKLYYEKKEEWDSVVYCINSILYCLQSQKDYSQIIKTTSEEIPLLEKKIFNSPLPLAKTYVFNGRAFSKKENFTKALEQFLKASTIFDLKSSNEAIATYSYKETAQIYMRLLDYPKAINYFEKALASDIDKRYTEAIHSSLSYTYVLLEKYDKAYYYYNQSISSKNISPEKEATLYNTGAEIFLGLKNPKQAKILLKKSLNISKNIKDPHFLNALNYTYLANIYLNEGKFDEAQVFAKKCSDEIPFAYNSKSRESAKLHVRTGEIYDKVNNLSKALSQYQQALIQVFPNFNSTDIADNPSINDIYTESWIMTASARKGEALRARYDQNQDVADLINAAECFDLSLAGIKALTDSYGTDNAKLYLSDYSHNYLEEAIEVNYLLLKAAHDQKYLEKIFSIMERSKANVLTEAIQKNRGLILAGIPDSLLELEQNLRLELADLNKSIKMEELYEEEADDEYITERRSRMTTQQREYEDLLGSLKNGYPQFKSYTEEPITPTVAEVQVYLANRNETLLEYFVGEENIYLIRIGADVASVHQFPHNAFWDDQVQDFQDYFRNSNAIVNDPKGYFAAAETLYHQLFPFDSLPEKIIIVPDGDLNFVPFDALMSEQPEQPIFTQANFLLRSHQIRHAYSAGLMLAPPPPPLKSTNKFLRIAPLFANRERGQAPLANGNQAIAAIPKLLTLEGVAATLTAFQEQAPNCRLVHLSTHAGADETDFAPRIEFIDQSLYLPELYAMKIPAELVVLSACETGLGKFEKGEGVMSLARGFAYAGASDLVASLWKVNEGSTSALINHFYTFLSIGNTKSEALRGAKLKYLEEAKSDAKMSPYYWAGFVSIGNDAPMDINPSTQWWWFFAAFGCILLLVIIWKKTR